MIGAKGAPVGGLLEFGEERARSVEAAHLHGEPVEACVEGAQIAAVIENGAGEENEVGVGH